MKRVLLFLALLEASALAQVNNPPIISVSSAPSGACTNGLPNQQVISTGLQYSCQSGTWGAVGSTLTGPLTGTSATFSGTVSAPSIVSPASSSATDSASLGPELTTSGTCTGTGWTGTYPTYTPPGTTAPLTCTGFTSGSYYQTVTTLAGNTGGGNLTIVIGTAQVATSSGASGTATAGLKANGTSLTYTPTAALNGTVTISAKLISPITTFSYQGKDSTGALSGQMLLQELGSLKNLFIGGGGIYNTTGYNNTANGYEALYANTTGSGNTANGDQALASNTTGYYNTANGYEALYANTTGYNNTANGYEALTSDTTGYNNTANGYEALYANTTGYNNTANGYEALTSDTSGFNNTANGYAALYANTTGSGNTANGYGALSANTTGYSNTANGDQALASNTTGYNNTANGYRALASNTTGYNNTANGMYAGQYIADGVTPNQTSSSSVYEGYEAYPLVNGDTNENVIGNTAIGHGSNTMTLGNSATVGTWLNGTQHITATAPTASAGTVAAYSSNAGGEITSLSAATSVTITFANSGWTNAAFCVANSSVAATQPYVTAQSNTAVTFTLPALTGNLFYHCDGN